jgi:hypothetical protein
MQDILKPTMFPFLLHTVAHSKDMHKMYIIPNSFHIFFTI